MDFRENRAKDTQALAKNNEEIRRICCEETDRSRQARIYELSMHSWLKFWIYRHSKFLVRCERILTLKQWAALERPTFPVNPLLFRFPMPCRDSGLPRDSQHCLGSRVETWHFRNTPASEREIRREPQNPTIPTPRHNQGIATPNPWSHTVGTYSHKMMMDNPRFPISEMHLGKFPDSLEFQSWHVNFKTEVCSN